ncbi:hypothetical protein KZX37_03350 [Microbacterium sp. EYE_5]|uniref:hypothetical protein n=1 Tax=unclassified Microbacterium TaxID=2609290 RepID=UPI0020061A8F|nr:MULTISPECIES: hypothetical protein [unclassified Microbacterium]MCK6079655.1 hypothetical protein [Microbacterium sp. EYE_382]MCK6084926.1 hypothetical protein [Microbacterium sp. EYE_384]MCK6122848.1 hypothetical protein [Microbacterium sp. EYE_80]MCK6125689.1 hypothetical protein [Microbacterium sp. EYE_79]MCK6140610.1 hypothetical protein [Microbacterium sp. EYE_39]
MAEDEGTDATESTEGTDTTEGAEHADPEEMPDTDELEEPSVAKEPGEEPKAPPQQDGEPSHHAVGIGVVESGPVDPGESPDEDPYEA